MGMYLIKEGTKGYLTKEFKGSGGAYKTPIIFETRITNCFFKEEVVGEFTVKGVKHIGFQRNPEREVAPEKNFDWILLVLPEDAKYG